MHAELRGKLLIDFEGVDGSGKHTQATILNRTINDHGAKSHCISFPNYDSQSSYLVKKFLNGDYEKALNTSVGYWSYYDESPVDNSLSHIKMICNLYTMDQFDTWNSPYGENKIIPKDEYLANRAIITDRFWLSNVIYQSVRLFMEMINSPNSMNADRLAKVFADIYRGNSGYAKPIVINDFSSVSYPNFHYLFSDDVLLYTFRNIRVSSASWMGPIIHNYYPNEKSVSGPHSTLAVFKYCVNSIAEYIVSQVRQADLYYPNLCFNLFFQDYALGRSLLMNREGEKDMNESSMTYMSLVNYLSPFVLKYLSEIIRKEKYSLFHNMSYKVVNIPCMDEKSKIRSMEDIANNIRNIALTYFTLKEDIDYE